MKSGAFHHMKMTKLARRLKVPKGVAVGIVESLFQITAENADEGDIGRHDNEEIFYEMDLGELVQDPDTLIEALVAAGWLDRDEEKRLVVHDWDEHAPKYVKDRVRQRNHRRSGKQPPETDPDPTDSRNQTTYDAEMCDTSVTVTPASHDGHAGDANVTRQSHMGRGGEPGEGYPPRVPLPPGSHSTQKQNARGRHESRDSDVGDRTSDVGLGDRTGGDAGEPPDGNLPDGARDSDVGSLLTEFEDRTSPKRQGNPDLAASQARQQGAEFWADVERIARQISRKAKPESFHDRLFVLRVAVLSKQVFSDAWLFDSLNFVCEKPARNSMAMLRTTLSNRARKQGFDLGELIKGIDVPAAIANPDGKYTSADSSEHARDGPHQLKVV